MRHSPVRAVVALVLGVVLGATLGWVTPPAHACACGAFEPMEARRLGVNSETAAILFDGQEETIALSMGLDTDSAEAAFLLPLPAKAELAVAGDSLFDELFDHTKPEVKVRYVYDLRFWLAGAGADGAAPGESGVQVLGRQLVGDYDVVQLSGSADAVGDWLSDNGFRVRDQVLAGLADYLQQDWIVLAVKLAFEGDRFAGGTAPLLVRFPSSELVYPMRLSAMAETSQDLRFYVFADHRQQVSLGGQTLDTTFAGWVDGAAFAAEDRDAAAELTGDHRWFLTRVDDSVDPDRITGDLEFAPAPEGDVEHREVIWRTEQRGGLVVAGIAGVLLLGVAATVVIAVVVHRRGQRQWREAHPWSGADR